MHTSPAVLEVSVQQYVFMYTDESSFTEPEGRSFYAYRIYLREFTVVFGICKTYFGPVGRNSPYLPAAIVCMRSCLGPGTHSHEQTVLSLTGFGEFLCSSMPRGLRLIFNGLS
jgi:hypothetical protein